MRSRFWKKVNVNVGLGNGKGEVRWGEFGKMGNEGKVVVEERGEVVEGGYLEEEVKIELSGCGGVVKEGVVVEMKEIMGEMMDGEGEMRRVKEGVGDIGGLEGEEWVEGVYGCKMRKLMGNEGEVVGGVD